MLYSSFSPLIQHLAKDSPTSLAHLAQQLRQPKAKLYQQLQQLQQLGLPVAFSADKERVNFYPCSPLLDWQHIAQQCQWASLQYHEICRSTNTCLLHQQAFLSKGALCLAEYQTAGRGQRGRVWLSPFAGQIMFSLFWTYPKSIPLDGLTLAIGVAIARALSFLGLKKVGLKWPNDLWLLGKKLGGILVEIGSPRQGENTLIIGVGINYTLASLAISQPYIALTPYLTLAREQVFVTILTELRIALETFSQQGLLPFLPSWQQFDVFWGKQVQGRVGDRTIVGIANGVDDKGQLKVREDNGIERRHRGGRFVLTSLPKCGKVDTKIGA